MPYRIGSVGAVAPVRDTNPLFNLPAGVNVLAYWDLSNAYGTLFTDTAGTMLLNAPGQTAARIRDLSPYGNHITQNTAANRMVYTGFASGAFGLQTGDGADGYSVDISAPKTFLPAGVGSIVVSAMGFSYADATNDQHLLTISDPADAYSKRLCMIVDKAPDPDRIGAINVGMFNNPAVPTQTYGVNRLYQINYSPAGRQMAINGTYLTPSFGVPAFQPTWDLRRFGLNRRDDTSNSNQLMTWCATAILAFTTEALSFVENVLTPDWIARYRLA